MYGMLVHLATVKRNTVSNVDGVASPSLADDAAGVPCLLQEKIGRVQDGASGLWLEYDAVLFVPFGTDVRPKGSAGSDVPDVVVVTDQQGTTLGTFTVLHVADEAGMGHHLVASLRRSSS